MVSFGLELAIVLEKPIGELRSRCDEEDCVRKHVNLLESDKVEISDGPLVGILGLVEKLAAKERTEVLINMIGQSRRSSIPRLKLRAVI